MQAHDGVVERELGDHIKGTRQPRPVSLHLRRQFAFDRLDTKMSTGRADGQAAFDRELYARSTSFRGAKPEDLHGTEEQRRPTRPNETERQRRHVSEESVAQVAAGDSTRGRD